MLKFFFQCQKLAPNQAKANQDQKFEEKPLKACFFQLYLSNLYLAYYKFC